jgi:hypothetical protein
MYLVDYSVEYIRSFFKFGFLCLCMIVEDYEVEDGRVVFNAMYHGESRCFDVDVFRECLSDFISGDNDGGGFFSRYECYDMDDWSLRYTRSGFSGPINIRIVEDVRHVDSSTVFNEQVLYDVVDDLLGRDSLEELKCGLDDRGNGCLVGRDGSDLVFVNRLNQSRLCVDRGVLFDSIVGLFESGGDSVFCAGGDGFYINLDAGRDVMPCCMCTSFDYECTVRFVRDGLSQFVVCIECADLFLDMFIDDYGRGLISYSI